MEIPDERLQKALDFLAGTDLKAANAKALVEGLSEQRKTIKSMLYIEAHGDQKKREAEAYAADEYIEHIEKYTNAIAEFETLRNRRITAALIVEVWRSCNANRRNGNI